jgi:hypothetical protein
MNDRRGKSINKINYFYYLDSFLVDFCTVAVQRVQAPAGAEQECFYLG